MLNCAIKWDWNLQPGSDAQDVRGIEVAWPAETFCITRMKFSNPPQENYVVSR